MTEDSRKSGVPSGDVQIIPSGDGGLHTAVDLRNEETLSIAEIEVQYEASGTNEAVVELHDEPDSTTGGNEDNLIEKFHISPGETINPDMVWPDVENDVLVTTAGNLDAEIVVTIGGYLTTV